MKNRREQTAQEPVEKKIFDISIILQILQRSSEVMGSRDHDRLCPTNKAKRWRFAALQIDASDWSVDRPVFVRKRAAGVVERAECKQK